MSTEISTNQTQMGLSQATYVKELDSQEQYYKERIEYYKALSDKVKRMKEAVKETIILTMEDMEVKVMESPSVKITLASAQPKVIVEDESLIVDQYKTFTVTLDQPKWSIVKGLMPELIEDVKIAIDKRKIIDLYRITGREIDGTKIEKAKRLTIKEK